MILKTSYKLQPTHSYSANIPKLKPCTVTTGDHMQPLKKSRQNVFDDKLWFQTVVSGRKDQCCVICEIVNGKLRESEVIIMGHTGCTACCIDRHNFVTERVSWYLTCSNSSPNAQENQAREGSHHHWMRSALTCTVHIYNCLLYSWCTLVAAILYDFMKPYWISINMYIIIIHECMQALQFQLSVSTLYRIFHQLSCVRS